MDRWGTWGAVVLVAGLAPTSFGQFGAGTGTRGRNSVSFGAAGAESPAAQPHAVKIVAADGKTTTGSLRLTTAVISCPFGIYEIKPEKVREIRFANPTGANLAGTNPAMPMGQIGLQRSGQIATMSGEVIEGMILIPAWWRVETELGMLTPNSEGIKSISFTDRANPTSPGELPPPGSIPTRPSVPLPTGESLPPATSLPPPPDAGTTPLPRSTPPPL